MATERIEDLLEHAEAVPFTQEVSNGSEIKDIGDDSPPTADGKQPETMRQSMYVRMYHEMITTVLDGERFLFTEDELELVKHFDTLPYEAQYLLVRLILRKAEKWYRSDSLKTSYQKDIPNLAAAMDKLCARSLNPPSQSSCRNPQTKREPQYIVIDDSDEDEQSLVPVSTPPCFAKDDSHASIHDLLDSLILPELRGLAKEMKVSIVDMKRKNIIDALIRHAENQKTFSFFKASGSQNQTGRLRAMVKKLTGRCIKINKDIRQLFLRVNLVFFRSTTLTATLLPLILSNTRTDNPSHRNYPKYTTTRTNTIFSSRESLLAYERALELEKQIDDALAQPSRLEGAWRAVAIIRDAIPRWEELLDASKNVDPKQTTNGARALERFEEGHVLTRVVYKGAYAYGVTKQHKEEEEILRSLLFQDKWRKGRRGAWYDRLALLCMQWKDKSQADFEEAWKIVKTGLDDPHTHLIYRPALEKRIARLEKKLEIPAEDRHRSGLLLKKSKQVLIQGRRVLPVPLSESTPAQTPARPASMKKGHSTPGAPERGSISSFYRKATTPSRTSSRGPSTVSGQRSGKENVDATAQQRPTGKSVWKGRDGEVSVEQLALEHYESQGYKGFHAEGRILVHIFTLLFWPILFDSSIPGAFETAFQTGPLDLVHDSFYWSREEAIEARLSAIEEGEAAKFIREADERERPQKTWAVGVRWDDFSLEDGISIVEGLGGKGLSAMCRLLCEDYANRGSGVPDLVVWNVEEHKTMFVEVKGPGDQLRENQRVWIDVMIRAGVAVEVCRVEDEDFKLPKNAGRKSRPPADEIESEDEERDYDAVEPTEGAPRGRSDSPMVRRQAGKKRPPSVLNEDHNDPAAPSPLRRKTA